MPPNLFEPLGFVRQQYGLVQGSRAVLLHYCHTITTDDLLKEHASFGRGGSIRNLLVHVANTYEFWIGKTALQKEMVFTPYEAISNSPDLQALYGIVDTLMQEFFDAMQSPAMNTISYAINGVHGATDACTLFSHVITHEYHHKGQVLSISRQLGYTPVDTDIMR